MSKERTLKRVSQIHEIMDSIESDAIRRRQLLESVAYWDSILGEKQEAINRLLLELIARSLNE